jgi:hypothetical protein
MHGMNISRRIAAIVAISADIYLTSVKVQNVDHTVDDLWGHDRSAGRISRVHGKNIFISREELW